MGFTRWVTVTGTLLSCLTVHAQTPRPFPRPGQQAPPPPSTPAPTSPSSPAPTAPPATQPVSANEVPTEATLGVPLYPSAHYLISYDAGRGQRFYLFGVNVPFADLVAYYRTALKQKGNELFESPPTHQFEVGRFREETMSFPPGITLKNYTWGGSAGYRNPRAGAQPEHFATIIQVVPPG